MMGLSTLNFILPVRAERHEQALQIANRFSLLQGKIITLLEHGHMENIVGHPLNQLVCNGSNSSGKWPAHLENTKKNINN